MGELLLCNEAIAAMPYYIEGMSINVYSIEELNYYIINNTYLLDDDFMSLELCTWIENHAHLPKLAMHLRTIISTNGRLSAFVTELLEYSGYCTKEELKNTHDALKELEEKSEFECLKIRADRLMEKKKYTVAIFEYKKLLSCEDAKHTERILYGNIYHNLATAYVQLFLFDIAADLYLEAFRQNGDRKSLWSCLYAYKLDNNDIGYARIVREYSVTEQEINNLDSVLKGVCAEASDGCDKGRQKETILKYKEDYRAHVI